MRKQVVALFLGLMTMVSFAQKKELKTAEKALKTQDYAAASIAIDAAKALNFFACFSIPNTLLNASAATLYSFFPTKVCPFKK